MESCGMSLVKYLLFAFNIIFCISGILLIVFGSIVLSSAIGTIEVTGDIATYVPSIILIVAGIIIFVIAFLGCYGAIRESYGMLMAFAVFLLIIFIVELAIGVAAAVNKDELKADDFRKAFNEDLANNKEKWDAIQSNFQCCGVNGPTDWGGSMPRSCCYGTQIANEQTNVLCTAFAANIDYIYDVGCFDKIRMKFTDAKKILIGIGIGIAFIEIVGIVLACWLATVIKREQNEPKE